MQGDGAAQAVGPLGERQGLAVEAAAERAHRRIATLDVAGGDGLVFLTGVPSAALGGLHPLPLVGFAVGHLHDRPVPDIVAEDLSDHLRVGTPPVGVQLRPEILGLPLNAGPVPHPPLELGEEPQSLVRRPRADVAGGYQFGLPVDGQPHPLAPDPRAVAGPHVLLLLARETPQLINLHLGELDATDAPGHQLLGGEPRPVLEAADRVGVDASQPAGRSEAGPLQQEVQDLVLFFRRQDVHLVAPRSAN